MKLPPLCRTCGKTIRRGQRRRIYCSQKCMVEWHKQTAAEKRAKKWRVCPICKKWVRRPMRKYCSTTCARIAENIKRRDEYVPGSTTARVKRWRRERQGLETDGRQLRCAECGNLFWAEDFRRRYCSAKCAHEGELRAARRRRRRRPG